MGSRKYDYVTLEDEFVHGRMSVRELGRQHGIPENRISSIHDKAKQPDPRGLTWYDKRDAYQNLSSDQAMKMMADHEARRRLRRLQVADHAIAVIDKAIGVLEHNLDPVTTTTDDGETKIEYPKVQIRDLAVLLDRLNPLFGQATTVTLTEERRLGISTPDAGQLGDGILAGLAALAARPVGPRVLESVGAGASPLPSAPDSRPDE